MGISGNNKDIKKLKSKVYENKPYEITFKIPIEITNKILKSICTINLKIKDNNIFGKGFFMELTDSKKYLITNYHIINQESKMHNIEIELWKLKKFKLKLHKRYIKFFPEPKDITIIEIKNNDEIYDYIEFLNFDLNYKLGYQIYNNIDILSIVYPLEETLSFASGKIININIFEFEHNIPGDNSSGCPIILLNNNPNIIQVIGIYKESNNQNELNKGTFIGEIFNDDLSKNNNYIIAEIEIKNYDVNKDIRIINSYEEYQRSISKDKDSINLDKDEINEEEIKKCEIEINNKSIPFNYFYKFKTEGNHTIKYIYNIYLTKTNYMFYSCDNIINLDLSNFNSKIDSNMHCMFSQCKSLINLNLNNFNTQNVNDMSWMFWGCKSLISLDISKFDTINVKTMLGMFSYCESLTKIELSKINTQNVKYMWNMFEGCKSLICLNLSNFNTKNNTNIGRMFYGCNSLQNLDISNFDTHNITDMSSLFFGCKSLLNVDVSNFDTENVTDMSYMFTGCELLVKIDISNFNTKNVINMSFMFYGCKSLNNLDLSNFNTDNVVHMNAMFENCESLKKMDLSNFNTENVEDMNYMFNRCDSLKIENIVVKDKNITDIFSQ